MARQPSRHLNRDPEYLRSQIRAKLGRNFSRENQSRNREGAAANPSAPQPSAATVSFSVVAGPRQSGVYDLKRTNRTAPTSRRLPATLASLLVAALALLPASCGYRVVGTADTIPDTIQTIAIPTFQNATTEYKIEQHLTRSVVREFITRTRYQVVNQQDSADATFSGTVLNFLVFPTIFDPLSGRATSIATLTQVHVVLRERQSGKVLYENPSFEYRERYEVSTDPEAYFEEREAALVRTGEGMARTLVSAVLSGF